MQQFNSRNSSGSGVPVPVAPAVKVKKRIGEWARLNWWPEDSAETPDVDTPEAEAQALSEIAAGQWQPVTVEVNGAWARVPGIPCVISNPAHALELAAELEEERQAALAEGFEVVRGFTRRKSARRGRPKGSASKRGGHGPAWVDNGDGTRTFFGDDHHSSLTVGEGAGDEWGGEDGPPDAVADEMNAYDRERREFLTRVERSLSSKTAKRLRRAERAEHEAAVAQAAIAEIGRIAAAYFEGGAR